MPSRIRKTLLLAAISCALASVAVSQTQTHKLLPDDGRAYNEIGISVAVSGNTAIVGSHDDDDNGTDSGSAYLFDVSTGVQIAKLTPDDGAANDSFGWSVSTSGSTAIVGSFGHDDNGYNSGSAYLFDVSTGAQIAKLTSDDEAAEDWFGYSVAISGNTAVVGSPGHDANGSSSGSAYVFDVITGAQIAKLVPLDGTAGDRFGLSVSVSENTAIVGSWLDDDSGTSSGSAYLFDVSTGAQIAKLIPDDGAAHDNFGRSVSVSGNTAIVGSWLDDDNGRDSGSAYLFDVRTGAQITKLTPDDGAAHDHFGRSVSVSGNTAIVGNYRDDDRGNSLGSAYLFDARTGAQIAKFTPSDGAAGDLFGYSTAIDRNTAIVASLFDDDNGYQSGSAYIFSVPNSSPDLEVTNIIRDGEFLNDPTRSGPWSVVKTGGVDVLLSSKLLEDAPSDPLPDTSYLTIKSEMSDDEWTLGQLIREVDEFGEYQLSFSARSKKGSDLVVALEGEGYGDVEDTFFLIPTTFNLTPEWQDFTVNFHIDDRFKRLDHVLIAIGSNEFLKENESIDIDHVSLTNWLGAETPTPQKPTELNARFVSRSAVLLEWDLPIGTAGINRYQILRDGNLVGLSYNRSYIDDKLATPGPYLYEIIAIDSKGYRSAPSPARKVFNGPNVQASDIVPYGTMSPDGKAFLREAQSEVTNNWQIKKSTEAGEFVVYEHDEPSVLIITAVANEGRAATGAIQVANTSGFMPFHWSEGGGMQIIGLDLPEEVQRYFSEGTGISADGQVVVGSLPVPPAFRYSAAFRWSSEDGLRWIGRIPANSWSESIAVSGDGSIVVGYESDIGFIWTKNRGLEHFEVPNVEADFSVFKDVSNDGKTSILESFSRRGSSSYVWTESDGFTELQGLEGDRNWVFARALSGSGLIAVGAGTDADRNSNAVFWNRKNNWAPVNINEFMLSVGHDTKGEFYSTVSNVSDDGQTLLLGAGGSTTRIRLNLSTRDSSTNLVRNGGFEESWNAWGLSRWDRSLSKEQKLVENPGFLGERAAKIRMGNLAGDPNSLHLRQSGIELEPNTDYYLSFSVKASMPGKAKARLFKDNDTSSNYGVDEEFELTTEWQTHVIEFRTDGLGNTVSDGRLQFTFMRGGYKRVLEFFVDEVAIHEK